MAKRLTSTSKTEKFPGQRFNVYKFANTPTATIPLRQSYLWPKQNYGQQELALYNGGRLLLPK